MRIWRSFKRLIRGWPDEKLPKPKRHELFRKDGWELMPPSAERKSRKYKGPLFPAPMLPPNAPVKPAAVQLCNQARRDWSSQRWKECESDYREAVRIEPTNAAIRFEQGQFLWSLGQIDDAEAALLEAGLNPDDYASWVSLLRISLAKHDRKQASLRLGKIAGCVDTPYYVSIQAARAATGRI